MSSPGETRLPYGHRDTLLSEQGRGWRCSDRPRCPVRTISAGIAPRGLSIGYTESSAFHVKPAYELPPSRTDEGVDGSFVRGTACFERKALPPSLMCFKCNVRQTMLPARHRNVWTLMQRQGCWHIRPWSMHAQCSAIVFHVKPAVCRSLTRLPTIRRQLHDGRGVECQLVRWPSIRVQPGSA